MAWADSADFEAPSVSNDVDAAGMGMSDEAAIAAEAVEEPEYYKPKKLKSRQQERYVVIFCRTTSFFLCFLTGVIYRARLGKPGQRSECFFCSHIGERDTALPRADVNKMVEMLRKNLGRMDMSVMCEMIADYYADFRRKINSQLGKKDNVCIVFV